MPTMASVGRGGRAAERGAAAAAPSAVWARRGLRRQEEKLRGREPGGSAVDVTAAVPGGGGSGCYGGSPAWRRPGPVRTRGRGGGAATPSPRRAPPLRSTPITGRLRLIDVPAGQWRARSAGWAGLPARRCAGWGAGMVLRAELGGSGSCEGQRGGHERDLGCWERDRNGLGRP